MMANTARKVSQGPGCREQVVRAIRSQTLSLMADRQELKQRQPEAEVKTPLRGKLGKPLEDLLPNSVGCVDRRQTDVSERRGSAAADKRGHNRVRVSDERGGQL